MFALLCNRPLRRLRVVLGVAVMGLVVAPSASGAAPLDTATATGTAIARDFVISNINISAQSGTSGQNPSGTASFSGSLGDLSGPVSCLSVTGPDQGAGTASAPTTAVLNFVDQAGIDSGLVVGVQLVDNGGDGADTIGVAVFGSGRAPTDCSPVLFTTATLTSGRAVVFDAPVLPPCTQTVGGAVDGGLAVADGQTYCLEGANVNGPLTVRSGGGLEMTDATVNGPLSSSGATIVSSCGSTVNGPVTVQGSTGPVVLGDGGDDATPRCAANTLGGPVTLAENTAGVELGGNTILGPVAVNANTGSAGPEIESNSIDGPLACASNTPEPTNDGNPNTVRGPETGQCSGL